MNDAEASGHLQQVPRPTRHQMARGIAKQSTCELQKNEKCLGLACPAPQGPKPLISFHDRMCELFSTASILPGQKVFASAISFPTSPFSRPRVPRASAPKSSSPQHARAAKVDETNRRPEALR